MNNKVLKRLLLGAEIALSLLFTFNVKTYVINASGFTGAITAATEETPLEDEDDVRTPNDNEEETTIQAEKGEAVAKGVKITTANNDNEKNTVNYMTIVDDDQIKENASTQAKTLAKHPNTIENEPMTDYTLSDRNHCWVPYWYWYTVINNQTASSMPKKHPANVKTSTQNVKKYQKYVNRKAHRKALAIVIIMVASITFFIVFLGVMFNRFA